MFHFKRVVVFSIILFTMMIHFSTALTAQDLRGMYVNDFKNILGDTVKENTLLEFAQAQGFNYLLFYNLRYISDNLYDLTTLESANVLARFIQKAKLEYQVESVGAVGQQFSSFEDIDIYNQFWNVDDIRRIDVYHIEFEFWNTNFLEKEWKYTDVDLAFEFYMNQLEQLRVVCNQRKVKCETYMGNVTESHCEQIGEVVDRVIVHYYRKSDVYNNGNSIYQYKAYRIAALAPSGNKVLDIIPLFSARPQFMGPWLESHNLQQAYNCFLYGQNAYAAQEGEWKNNINMLGASWYRYTDLAAVLYNAQQAVGEAPPNYYQDLNPRKAFVKTTPILNVYPQPANQQLTISLSKEIKSIQVFNALGQKVKLSFLEKTKEKITFSTASWNSGMYVFYVRDKDNLSSSQKVLIQH